MSLPGSGPEGDRDAEPSQPALRGSVWSRFWLPFAYLEPQGGRSPQLTMRRNAKWIDAHMVTYLKRWAIVWLLNSLLLGLDADDPGFLTGALGLVSWAAAGVITLLLILHLKAKLLLSSEQR